MTLRAGAGERVYRGLLRLYPADFRRRFSEDMVQLFHDQLRDARTGGAPGGTVGAWLRMLGDVAANATSEHLRRDRTVAHSLTVEPSLPARALGIAGIVGGAVLLAVFVLPVPEEFYLLRVILFNLGAIAVVLAAHRRQAAVGRTAALVAAVPAVVANAWHLAMVLLSVGRDDPFAGDFGTVFFWAAMAMWLAISWFGLVALWLGAVNRWAAIALAIGGVLALTGIDRLGLTSGSAPTIFAPLSQIGIVMVGISWILLGIDVATRRLIPAPAATPDR